MNHAITESTAILDGRALAEKIKLDLRRQIVDDYLRLKKNPPGLAAITVGGDEASAIYLRLKKKACEEVGLDFHQYSCLSEKEILELISFLNSDPTISGIIVQLPLPAGYDTEKIISAIAPDKDADGFQAKAKVMPPTIAAIIELIKTAEAEKKTAEKISGQTAKKTLIIGKSDIFLNNLKAHLTRELDLKNIVEEKTVPADSADYDIIVIALGQAKTLKKNMIKPDAIVIDVGINRRAEKTVGDVDPAAVAATKFLSPVPGGVGPLTVAFLLKNTLTLAEK